MTTVFIDGAGERGLCAGGDIRALRESALADGRAARDFWAAEYRLNARIARYPKPVVAIMNGIVMGGGIGLAGHASHRVAMPDLRAAMPEVGIGFYPDVGGTWLLAKAPGRIGEHLALTGTTVNAADAVFCGLADVEALGEDIPQLTAALAQGVEPRCGRSGRSRSLGTGSGLAAAREWIDLVVRGFDSVRDPRKSGVEAGGGGRRDRRDDSVALPDVTRGHPTGTARRPADGHGRRRPKPGFSGCVQIPGHAGLRRGDPRRGSRQRSSAAVEPAGGRRLHS